MPGIAPVCRAWRYADHSATGPLDIATRLAPPYDVVTAELRRRLIEIDPACSVAVDVPQVPIDRIGPDAAYEQALRTFDSWMARGTLTSFPRPAIGVLRQTFAEGPHVVRRHAVLAELPLTPLGSGAGLFAHEETGSGPRGDRLALLNALRVQTSPIFGLYSDEEGSVEEVYRHVEMHTDPGLVGVSTDRALSELWLVEDEPLVERLIRAFGRREVIIADGHHRYASQLAYLESLGSAAPPAARSCLFALVAQEDTGMSIRAMHHVFGGIDDYSIDAVFEALEPLCRFEEVPGGPVELAEHVARAWFERSHPIGLVDFASRRCFVMTTRFIDPLAEQFPEAPEIWRRAAPVVCERLLARRTLCEHLNGGRELSRRPVFDVADLVQPDRILPGARLGVVMLPVSLADVLTIAPSGYLLPPNSTFFWPKMPTGLIFKSLE